MDDFLHFLGLAYFIFMGVAAFKGLEDQILPGKSKQEGRRVQAIPPVALQSPWESGSPPS